MIFNEFVKQVVSFDFDETLRTGGSDRDWSTWQPIVHMHDLLKREAKRCKIIIITKRSSRDKKDIGEFLKKYKLPVKEIHTTGGDHKYEWLTSLQVIRHYDDDRSLQADMEGIVPVIHPSDVK